MDNREPDILQTWADDEAADLASGRANAAFLARVRHEHARRRRPVIAVIGAVAALAACAAVALILFPAAPGITATAPTPAIVDIEPVRPAQELIEASDATLATLMRLNARSDIDTLILSRADCVAWTSGASPLGP
jgi:hypothetical protein